MKRLMALFVLLVSFWFIGYFSRLATEDISTLKVEIKAEGPEDFLRQAIAEVESGSDPCAVGKNGEVGILQIRPIMVYECNRIVGHDKFNLNDRWDTKKSAEMFQVYSEFWCDQTLDYTKEGIARRWNGGPKGHLKPETEAYWRKVSALVSE